ncbi:MAG TPA: hypothetical protein VJN39_09480 [Gemmatimonadales bacterium]|nr:hypothetical protein [Gemmatimonadales bacterium]
MKWATSGVGGGGGSTLGRTKLRPGQPLAAPICGTGYSLRDVAAAKFEVLQAMRRRRRMRGVGVPV